MASPETRCPFLDKYDDQIETAQRLMVKSERPWQPCAQALKESKGIALEGMLRALASPRRVRKKLHGRRRYSHAIRKGLSAS